MLLLSFSEIHNIRRTLGTDHYFFGGGGGGGMKNPEKKIVCKIKKAQINCLQT